MVDGEVVRLRKLRSVALRARALGRSLDSTAGTSASIFGKGSALCWTITRIVTGRLRAHPYQSYQSDHGQFAGLTDAALGATLASAARRQKREFSVFADYLQSVAREVDDVRSVSWSPDLSDALGRMQTQLRSLIDELDGMLPVQRSRAGSAKRRPPKQAAVEGNWPYLAI